MDEKKDVALSGSELNLDDDKMDVVESENSHTTQISPCAAQESSQQTIQLQSHQPSTMYSGNGQQPNYYIHQNKQPIRMEQTHMQGNMYAGNPYFNPQIQIQRSPHKKFVNVPEAIMGGFTIFFGFIILVLSIYTIASLNPTSGRIWGSLVIFASGIIAIVAACRPKNKQLAVSHLMLTILGTAVSFGSIVSYPFLIKRYSGCKRYYNYNDDRIECKTAQAIYGSLIGFHLFQLIVYTIALIIKCIRSYSYQFEQTQNISYQGMSTPSVQINVPNDMERNVFD